MEQTIIRWITLHGCGVIFIVLALGIFGLPFPNELILASLGWPSLSWVYIFSNKE